MILPTLYFGEENTTMSTCTSNKDEAIKSYQDLIARHEKNTTMSTCTSNKDEAIKSYQDLIARHEKNIQEIILCINRTKELPINVPLMVVNHHIKNCVLVISDLMLDSTEVIVRYYAVEHQHKYLFGVRTDSKFMLTLTVDILSLISWRLWVPEDAALTINWELQSAGYKKLAYGE
jgi:hypothetical protein